ncbi:MAG: DUF4403 family protein [Lewinellaceae bacterium]|nr:DUF4403 family protein [Lewinellaceae bacterium]
MRKKFLLGVIVPVLVLAACKTRQPIRPAEDYENLYEEQLSVINVPVDISLRGLERSLNQELDGVIYEDNDIDDGDNMRIRAEKSEDIRLGIDSQLIKYRIPLSLWVQYDIGISRVEAEGEISIDFKTAFAVTEDWNVITVTEIVRYAWMKKPRLKMGVVNLPIGFIADLILENSKTKLTRSIDGLVQEQFDLRQIVTEAWEEMFRPMLVSEAYNTWLTVNPQAIGMTPLEMKGDRIKGTIFIESRPRVNIGRPPAHTTPAFPLPPLQFRQDAGDDFTIHLNTHISYEEAERIAKSELVGETFSQGRRSVTVEDIELYGQGNKIIVNTVLSGSYNGSIYLAGKPVYNSNKNAIEIESLDYELGTRNFLLKSAGWLLKSTLKNKIEDNMNFLLDYNLQEMRTQFQEQLEAYEITDEVVLNGELQDLAIRNAFLAPESIIVDLALNGRLNINVKGLDK